jgi:hypothetical protein
MRSWSGECRRTTGGSSWQRFPDEGFALLQRAQRTHLEGVRRLFFQHLDDDSIDALGTVWRRVRQQGA